jgi:DNA-binding beta-propeller fold protein YncE
LPGASPPASLDYIACDRPSGRVWVPVGDTGSVDVYDPSGETFTRVDGFKTVQREWHGKTRTMGPSSISIGDGVAYVGDRGSNEVCAVDIKTMKVGRCTGLPSSPDGVDYVPSTKELWVTTPGESSVTVLDASQTDSLPTKTTIRLEGRPEGYAVDSARRLFLTNLEDKDRTVAIDLTTHQPKATWSAGCGSEGPRGVAVDSARGFIYVACTDGVVVLDGAHDGARLGRLDVGAGIDNIDWLAPRRQLFVAAAKAGKLAIVHVDDSGQPTIVATGESPAGARNGVADMAGVTYVADPLNARLLVFAAPAR